jgi:hypothetical protein
MSVLFESVSQQLPQSGSGPVEPGPDGASRYAEDDGRLLRVEILPADQHDQLAIVLTQLVHRRPDHGGRIDLLGQIGSSLRELQAESLGQPVPPETAPPVIGEHSPGDAVQPEPRGAVDWYVVEPSPGHQHALGDHIGRVVGRAGSAQGIPEQLAEVAFEELTEPFFVRRDERAFR